MKYHVSCNGAPVERMTLRIPNVGPWWCVLDMCDEADRAQGAAEIRVGDVVLLGTVDPLASGKFAGTRKMRVVAGAGAWGTLLDRKAYHSDSGVQRSQVAQDAAREAGEALGVFSPVARLQSHYVRPSGAAAQSLEYAAGGTPWWLDFAGVTHVTERPAVPTDAVVLTYNTRERFAELSVDSIDEVAIGSQLSDRLDPAITVRDIEVTITPEALRMRVWHGEADTARAPLARMIETVARKAQGDRLFGCYTYQVTAMQGDRVSLRARLQSMPDLPYVKLWPGVAGVLQQLTDGAEVLVQFRDGDRSAPVVTHYAPSDGSGFVPVSIDIAGNGSGLAAARQGDLVRCGGPGTVVTMWPVTGTPPAGAVAAGVPHFISFDPTLTAAPAAVLAAPLYGAIDTGSQKVRIGT